MKDPIHLQSENPIMSFEDFVVELANHFANAESIDSPMAARKFIDMDKAREWWEDGFTPYVTFRENYNQ